MKAKQFKIYDNKPVYTDRDGGAVFLLEDNLWHPFGYFSDGNMEIMDEGYQSPLDAYNTYINTFI